MIIFLYGPNSYIKSKKLEEITAEYRRRLGSILLERFDLEVDNSFEKLSSYISANSIFDNKKFAIIENPFESKEKKELKKILEKEKEQKDNILILLSDTKPSSTYSFLLEKPVISQEFKDLKRGNELNNLVKKEAIERGMRLTENEIETLTEIAGGDLWFLMTELDKICLSQRKLLSPPSEQDFFKTINLFKGARERTARVVALEIILSARGDEPAKVFNMLSFGWNKKEFIDSLADYDVMIKSGQLEYEEALLDIALR